MTKRQFERYMRLSATLSNLGITQAEIDTLLRCERALSLWAERECNGDIQRDEITGKAYWWNNGEKPRRLWLAPDRETGALKRAAAIAQAHGLTIYHQGDPRGCCLYLIRPGDVPQGSTVDSCYTNGIAVCID